MSWWSLASWEAAIHPKNTILKRRTDWWSSKCDSSLGTPQIYLCWDWVQICSETDLLPMLYLCRTCHREWKGMVHCRIESLAVVSFAITASRCQMVCMMIKHSIIMNHGMIMNCSWWYAKWFNWSDVSMQKKSLQVSDDSLLWCYGEVYHTPIEELIPWITDLHHRWYHWPINRSKSQSIQEFEMSFDFIQTNLVGGFNPFEKYESEWESSPGRGENKKYLNPPPRNKLRLLSLDFNHPNHPLSLWNSS